jgi:Ni/Fe-hydrogenase 1 B-type cytochrome subunit
MKESAYAEYYQVYVWDLPIRLFHWINALSIFVLGVSGILIAHPIGLTTSSEAYSQFYFARIQFVHYLFGYIFLINFLGRIYWGFMGNQFALWKNHFPRSSSKWKEILQVLCLDILLICRLPVKSIGINALAGIIYLFMYLAIAFQIFTGFALYSLISNAWFPHLFSWVIPLMGGVQIVRQWHHFFTWIFVAFTMAHIYLSWYHDYLEGRGTISSMIGGWKFIEKPTQIDY